MNEFGLHDDSVMLSPEFRIQLERAVVCGDEDRLVLADLLEIDGDAVRAAWWRTLLLRSDPSWGILGFCGHAVSCNCCEFNGGFGAGSGSGDGTGSGGGEGCHMGYGDGYSYSYGSGNGDNYGSGDGDGDGNGEGDGYGDGNSKGDGDGYGYGRGTGAGHGDGTNDGRSTGVLAVTCHAACFDPA